MEKISKLLAEKMLFEKMICEDEKEWFTYALQIVIEKFIGYATIIVFAIHFDCFFQTVGFIFVFSGVRKYSGGVHLKNFWSCYLLSVGTYFVWVIIWYLINPQFTIYVLLLVCMLCLCIFIIGAENSELFNWKTQECSEKRNLTRLNVLILLTLICVLYFLGIDDSYLWFMGIGIFQAALGLILSKYKYSKE